MPRILLVDDDPGLRKMLRLTLERLGHQVEEATNGKEAIQAYKRSPSDLILTDLVMPEMDGIETIMQLTKTHPDVRIIAMSGGGRMKADTFLPTAKKLGANYTLTKPFTTLQLSEALATALLPPMNPASGTPPPDLSFTS